MHRSVLIRIIEKFGYEDRMDILAFLNSQKKIKITETGEGSIVNMDKMPDDIYDKLVVMVEKIKNKKIDAVNLI
jgi:hypothetical protein